MNSHTSFIRLKIISFSKIYFSNLPTNLNETQIQFHILKISSRNQILKSHDTQIQSQIHIPKISSINQILNTCETQNINSNSNSCLNAN